MKKTRLFWLLAALSGLLLATACTGNLKLRDEKTFQGKTGVIGVFRQSAFYCSEAIPHYAQIGDSTIVVKPTWSSEQDNVFFTPQKPGRAMLRSYTYHCGDYENKFVLDTAAENKGSSGIVIPEQGFCKIVISFVQGDRLFDHNDALLDEVFKREKVALDASSIPYCEVVSSDGAAVSFANKDSLLDAQYEAAIEAARDGSCEDIRPLISIDENSDKVTWNVDKNKVLMVVAHTNPAVFEDVLKVTFDKETRVFSDKEMLEWFKANRKSVRNWPLRIRQLLGLPRGEELTHFTTVWVDPKDMVRPAYIPDIASAEMTCRFNEEDDSQLDSLGMWLRNWFDNTWAASYKEHGYPWTRLGYTYDWGSKGDKYGLSEFLIMSGAEVQVQTTKEFKAYLKWLADRN